MQIDLHIEEDLPLKVNTKEEDLLSKVNTKEEDLPLNVNNNGKNKTIGQYFLLSFFSSYFFLFTGCFAILFSILTRISIERNELKNAKIFSTITLFFNVITYLFGIVGFIYNIVYYNK